MRADLYRWIDKPKYLFVIAFILGCVVFIVLLLARNSGYLEAMELLAYDNYLQRIPRIPQDDRIILIGETEPDIQRFGHPLSDEILAQALDRLLELNARVIGVDKYRDIPVPPGSKQLRSLLSENTNIVWITHFGNQDDRSVPPPDVLVNTNRTGFNDFLPDRDGIVRRGLLFMDAGGVVAQSFALTLALHYLSVDRILAQPDKDNPELLRLGQTTIPPFEANDGGYVNEDAAGYQMILDYGGFPQRFATYSLSDLIDGKVPAESVKDRIVLIGAMSDSIPDYFFTPFWWSNNPDNRVTGVELHAIVLDQFLRLAKGESTLIRTFTTWQENLWIGFWCIAGSLFGIWSATVLRLLVITMVGVIVLVLGGYFAQMHSIWIPVVPPALGWLVSIFLISTLVISREKALKAMMSSLFSMHMSREIADKIWDQRDQILERGHLKPQRLTATILFTDIRGFTTVSEGMEPSKLMSWLDEYMDAMTRVIIEQKGTVYKYIGDAVMAAFGAPNASKEEKDIAANAVRAVDSALLMGEALKRLNTVWEKNNMPMIGMRVGVHTGTLVQGSLGSAERMELAVIGDTVNTASRLESFKNPDSKINLDDSEIRILVSESTYRLLGDRFVSHKLGSIVFKGKSEGVDVYRITGRK